MSRTWSGRRVSTAVAAVAVGAALLSMAPVGPVGVGTAVAAEAAEPPAEVVIPAEFHVDPDAGLIPAAGETGFLQGGPQGGYHWVSYADGTRTEPFGDGSLGLYGPVATGTDLIAAPDSRQVTFRDPRGGAPQYVSVPEQHWYITVLGNAVVTRERAAPYGMHLRSLEQGAVVDRPLSGLPAGAEPSPQVFFSGPYGFVLRYVVNGNVQLRWVDRSFTVRPEPLPAFTLQNARAAGRFLLVTQEGKLRAWDLTGDWSAPAAELAWTGGTAVALIGDHVLARVPSADGLETLVARSVADGTEHQVLDRVFGETRVAPDGRLLAARQGEGGERTLHSVRATETGGTPVATKTGEVPAARTKVKRTAVAQGIVYATDQVPYNDARVRSVDLSLDGKLSAGPRVDRGSDDNVLRGACWVSGDCDGGVPTGDGRVVFREVGWGGGLYVLDAGKNLPAVEVPGVDDAILLGASGRHVLYTADSETRVLDLDTQQVMLRRPQTGHGVHLDGATLWEGAAGGVLKAVDVRSGAVTRSVKAADCELSAWSVVGSYVLSACGDTYSARDLTTGKVTAVPGRFARLGDGYVLSEQGADTVLTSLRGAGGTRKIATGATDTSWWGIDRFGGGLVHSDDQDRIHVVPSGVPASDLAALDADVAEVLDLKVAPEAVWTARFWLNKPAASWALTLKDRAGNAVRTLRGGEARGLVKAVWDGKGEGGTALADGRYTWELAAAPADGSGPELRRTGEVFLTHGGLGTYEPVTPARVLDTRSGLGAARAQVGPGGTVTLQVTGRGGVAPTGVSAVVLNVTAVNPTRSTFVSVYPYGTQRPTSSSLNAAAGRTVPNLVTVPVKDGKVTLYNHAGTVDLVADVAGYYTLSGEGDRFLPVEPARVLDTRSGLGAPKAKVGAARTVSVQVAGRGGVPATGVSAVVLNVTATGPTASSFVSVYPYGTQRPSASHLNVVAGQTVANLVVVPVRDGKVTLYNHAGTIDLLADVAGYFTTSGQGDRFRPLPPQRVMDTRENWMALKLGPDQSAVLEIAGIGGVPATGASAVVLNVTATNATASTYIAVHPTLTNRPVNSNLNLGAGQTVANQVVVPVVNGRITFYNRAGSTDVIVDVFGYYTD